MLDKLLLLGGSGQLGQALLPMLNAANWQVLAPTRQELDLLNVTALAYYLRLHKPDVVINTAAMTQVDLAEQQPELADAVNHLAVVMLAQAARQVGAAFMQISTDQVFDGQSNTPYLETDAVNPINVYGRSKLAGEQALQREYGTTDLPWWVLRTSWLYGAEGPRWLRQLDQLAAQGADIKVVTDQVGAPTAASWLAQVIVQILMRPPRQPLPSGIYHATLAGQVSKYDLARQHLKYYAITPVLTEYFTAAVAARPRYMVLDSQKLAQALGIDIPTWQSGLKQLTP